jgi:predicted HTH transcriptional regulator
MVSLPSLQFTELMPSMDGFSNSLSEAMLFCQWHLPLPGHIAPRRLERMDRPLIPPNALREIIVNTLIHRDYTIAGGAVSLAICDDRVEVWSVGLLPFGVTPEALSREYDSIQHSPLIVDFCCRVTSPLRTVITPTSVPSTT